MVNLNEPWYCDITIIILFFLFYCSKAFYYDISECISFEQGNAITCTCVSGDKRWLATGDKGRDHMVVIWDTDTGSVMILNYFHYFDLKK